MHLIIGTLFSLLLLKKTYSKPDGRRSMLFVTSVVYDRIKIPNSKELFVCEAVFGNYGFFCLHCVCLNLESYRLASFGRFS